LLVELHVSPAVYLNPPGAAVFFLEQVADLTHWGLKFFGKEQFI
jgi:hypothetical protein